MDTEKTMGRVSRPETVENYEFSKDVKLGTFWEAENRLNGAARGPRSISKFFSGTPQYLEPQRELLGCPGARDRRGAPWIFSLVEYSAGAEHTFRTFHIAPY